VGAKCSKEGFDPGAIKAERYGSRASALVTKEEQSACLLGRHRPGGDFEPSIAI